MAAIAVLTSVAWLAACPVFAQSGFRPARTAPEQPGRLNFPSTERFQRATYAEETSRSSQLPQQPIPARGTKFQPARFGRSNSAEPVQSFPAKFNSAAQSSKVRWTNARSSIQQTSAQHSRRTPAVRQTHSPSGSSGRTIHARYQQPTLGKPRYHAQHVANTNRNPSRSPIQQVQHVRPTRKPLPPQILSMPTVQDSMEVIHHRSQLLVARNNIVRTAIADDSVIDIAQFSPREISIIGIGLGTTTLTIWFENNPQPLIYLVKTIPDPSLEEQKHLDYGRLERKLQVLFPNSKVYLIPISGKIVVKGQARDATEAARILQIVRNEVINQEGRLGGPQPGRAINRTGLNQVATGTVGVNGNLSALDLASSYVVNMLEVPGEYQVMLRVRIAELNRSQLKRLGIDFNYLLNGGRHAVSYALGGLPSTITGVFENGEINVLVNWLASNGTAKILSEPVLTVLSGHSASMLSGGEFAVPTIVGIGGAQGQQTTFRGFGTSLVVTPSVLDRDLIRMQIVPEFSQINQGNAVNGIPGVDSRRVQTTIELREGQTIAIAGLLSHRLTTEVTRIPLLSSIPYLGSRLFASKQATVDETELLVLVTPELVRPMDPDEVPPVPGFNVTPPNSYELYSYGMTEGIPDNEVYQLAPYGRGAGVGEPVGYRLHNPSPATPGYPPAVTNPYPGNPQRPFRQLPATRQQQIPLPQPSRFPSSQQAYPPNSPGRTLPPNFQSQPSSSRHRPYSSGVRKPGRRLPAPSSNEKTGSTKPRRRSLFSVLGLKRSQTARQ